MEKLCRFCLDEVCNLEVEGVPDPHQFVSPCKCSGSQKYVHRACLEKWRRNGVNSAFSKCMVCNTEYKLASVTKDGQHATMNCLGEFILIFEATGYFLYMAFCATMALGIGSVFTGVLLGPILGILVPIQHGVEKSTHLPMDHHTFFYDMVIPGAFFLIFTGLILILHTCAKEGVTEETKNLYVLLGVATFCMGVTLVHTCIHIWMKITDFITERRLKLVPEESIALDLDCI
jgi:hypothetical protein